MKKIGFFTPVLIIAVVVLFNSCGTSAKLSSVDALNGAWQLTELKDGGDESVHTNDMSTIAFDLAGKKVSGIAGCNNFVGGFTSEEAGKLTFGKLALTRKMCIGDLNAFENLFTKKLELVNKFEVKDDNALILYTSDNSTITYKKVQ
ncbi:MAG: META domain-containing protein [Bacteroidales bacterium]